MKRSFTLNHKGICLLGNWNNPKSEWTNWSGLGPGIDIGPGIYAISINQSNGDVYIGGSFTSVGGVSAINIAKWDGTNWSGLGTDPMNESLNLVVLWINTL